MFKPEKPESEALPRVFRFSFSFVALKNKWYFYAWNSVAVQSESVYCSQCHFFWEKPFEDWKLLWCDTEVPEVLEPDVKAIHFNWDILLGLENLSVQEDCDVLCRWDLIKFGMKEIKTQMVKEEPDSFHVHKNGCYDGGDTVLGLKVNPWWADSATTVGGVFDWMMFQHCKVMGLTPHVIHSTCTDTHASLGQVVSVEMCKWFSLETMWLACSTISVEWIFSNHLKSKLNFARKAKDNCP